jgi:hypothetical protein
MNTIRIIRRLACTLAGLAAATLVAFPPAAPAAFATHVPPPGMGDPGKQQVPPAVHVVVAGGMPGWQIALIAAGAAVVAAVLAVLADRAWAARRHVAVPSA